MMKKVTPSSADAYLFFGLIFLGLLIALHGKPVSMTIFGGAPLDLGKRNDILSYVVCAMMAGSFQWLRASASSLEVKLILAPSLALSGITLLHWWSTPASVLIYCLQLFILTSATGVIALEPTLKEHKMQPEFWKLFLDFGLRISRYILMLYVAGFALLKFLSEGVGESKNGFLTSFIYPSIVVAYCFFILGYWLALPAWKNLVQSYKVPQLVRPAGARQIAAGDI